MNVLVDFSECRKCNNEFFETKSRSIYYTYNQILIMYNSLTSIWTIENLYLISQVAQRIHIVLESLTHKSVRVTFVWIPAHRDIVASNLVDLAAKLAIHKKKSQPNRFRKFCQENIK